MHKLRINNSGFANLVALVLVVIVAFCILFIGAYVNAAVHENLIDNYPNNQSSGTMSATHWHNATAKDTNVTRNVTLTCVVSQLNSATTRWYIHANGSALDYNLTVNENKVNDTSNLTSGEGFNWTLAALITAGAVANSDDFLNFTWNLTAPGNRVYICVRGTYFVSSDYRTLKENNTYNRMGNVSNNWDSSIDIVQVVVIITILAASIGAIFLFTKFRG